MVKEKTTKAEEKKKQLLENLLRDTAKIDEAYKKRDMNLAEGCKDFDYYLNGLKKLEPQKKYTELMNEIEKYSKKAGGRIK